MASLFRSVEAVISASHHPVLLAAGTVALLVSVYCWTVKNGERTTNAVKIISAFRGQSDDDVTSSSAGRRRRRLAKGDRVP
jgi:hypothetical protein